MKKTLKMHEEKKTKTKNADAVPEGAVPAYLLDREKQTRAKVLSNMIKQKRKEKAVSIIVRKVVGSLSLLMFHSCGKQPAYLGNKTYLPCP